MRHLLLTVHIASRDRRGRNVERGWDSEDEGGQLCLHKVFRQVPLLPSQRGRATRGQNYEAGQLGVSEADLLVAAYNRSRSIDASFSSFVRVTPRGRRVLAGPLQ